MREHPSGLQDGRFLANFYTCYPSDRYFHAFNQQYWLEYHPTSEAPNPHCKRSTHLLCPTKQSPAYAVAEGLMSFRQWVRLTNADTYIFGPFDFAIANNKKSPDHVPEPIWTALGKFSHLFTNKVTNTDLPEYTIIQYSQSHTVYSDDSHNERLCAYLASSSIAATV